MLHDEPLTEPQQRERDQADALLDVMDSLAPQLIRQADAFTKRNPGIEVSALDWETFVATVEDAVSDLLHDQRERLALEHAKDRRYMPRTSFPKAGTAMNFVDEVIGTIKAYNRAFLSAPDTLQRVPNQAMAGFSASREAHAVDRGMVNPHAAARRVVSTGMSCQDLGE